MLLSLAKPAIRPSPVPLLLSKDVRDLGRRLAREGDLVAIRRGVHVDAERWKVLAPWERYLARVHAVAQTWDTPIFCLESSAALSGLPIFGEPRDIHLLSLGRRSWREGDVVIHGWRDARAWFAAEGCSITSLVDTATDLGRVLPPAFGLAVVDAALRVMGEQEVPLDVSAHGRAQDDRRGVRRLDWIQQRATATAESVGESVSRAAIEWLGNEAPELQVEFAVEGESDRPDFFWRRQETIGESDGYGKYDAEDAEATKAHFVREKKREDRLRRHVRGFARWDWTDTIRWPRLDAKLAASGLERIRPRQDAMLATLALNPRSAKRPR